MKRNLFASISIVFLLCALLGSCSGQASLKNTRWKMTEMNGQKDESFSQEKAFTLFLDIEKEFSIAGTAACNNFFGTYEGGDSGKVSFKVTGTTMKSCPEMGLEQPYFEMLQSVDSYQINHSELTLLSEGKAVAKFKNHE